MHPDATGDTIHDFNAGQDLIDLSLYPFLRNLGQLTHETTATGARISYWGDTLTIHSHDGLPLDWDMLSASLILPLDHYFETVADSVIAAAPADNVTYGTAGGDIFSGGDADDIFVGFGGGDVFQGGAGHDLVSYMFDTAGLRLDLMAQADSTGTASGDVLVGIEGIEGGSGDDRFAGDPGYNTLVGGAGDDKLYGRSGMDRIYGGPGDDRIHGGKHKDKLFGEDGNDRIYGNWGKDYLSGGNGNDHLMGGLGDDRLEGDAGDDRLEGQEGNDRLWGGSGADTFVFSSGHDTIFDFAPSEDRLLLDPAVWGNLELTLAEVLDTYGSVTGDGLRLDFGAASLTLIGLDRIDALTDVTDFV